MQTSSSVTTADSVHKLNPSEIAAAAYHLYLEQGSRDGHALDDWLRAEQLLMLQLNNEAPANPGPPKEPANSIAADLRPLDDRQHPGARDERGTANREDIRRQSSAVRPASRQPQSSRKRAEQSA